MNHDSFSTDWQIVQSALTELGRHLTKPTRLVLIGSSVGMWYGQPGRMTEDIDVWVPRSDLDLGDIVQACEKAGLHFDPQGFDAPQEGLYMQMIKPGIVNVGKWRDDDHMFVSGNLTVVHPPAQNLIASKLMRAEPSDLEDIVFLMARLKITLDEIKDAIKTLPKMAAETAQENLVYIELHQGLLAQATSVARSEASRASSALTAAPRPR